MDSLHFRARRSRLPPPSNLTGSGGAAPWSSPRGAGHRQQPPTGLAHPLPPPLPFRLSPWTTRRKTATERSNDEPPRRSARAFRRTTATAGPGALAGTRRRRSGCGCGCGRRCRKGGGCNWISSPSPPWIRMERRRRRLRNWSIEINWERDRRII